MTGFPGKQSRWRSLSVFRIDNVFFLPADDMSRRSSASLNERTHASPSIELLDPLLLLLLPDPLRVVVELLLFDDSRRLDDDDW